MSALLLLALAACRSSATGGDPAAVQAVLDAQVQRWNAGDIPGFMAGYWRSDRTRFQSGGDVTVGWQTVLDRYQRRYRDRAAMGTLIFSEVEVEPIAAEVALAHGRWTLQRAQDRPTGLFTLILRRFPEGWRITHDHTSLAAPP